MLPSFPKFFPAFSSFVHNSPAFFTERLKQKSQHTAANSTMSTAFVCAFRFPREVRFDGFERFLGFEAFGDFGVSDVFFFAIF